MFYGCSFIPAYVAQRLHGLLQDILRSLDNGNLQSLLPTLRMVSKRFRGLADAQVATATLSFCPTSVTWKSLLLQRLENLEELDADLRTDESSTASSILLLLDILNARPSLQKLNIILNDNVSFCDKVLQRTSKVALQKAMQKLTDLHSLSLSGYGSISVSTQMLCTALQSVAPLKELLVRVAIGNQGVHRLAPSIRGNQSVVRLNLSGTAIGDIGAVQLAACLEENITLEDLDVSHVCTHLVDDWCPGHIASVLAATS